MNITKDSDLTTVQQLSERIASIERQRYKLSMSECRDNSIEAFDRKNRKISRLTERHEELWIKRAKLLRSAD